MYFEFVCLVNYFVNGVEIEFSYDFMQVLCYVLEEGYNVIYMVSKMFMQSFVLCGDIDRVSVFMIFMYYDIVFNYQCSGCDVLFFSV